MHSGVARFVAVYLSAFAVYSVAGRDRRVIAYFVVLSVTCGIALLIHRTARFSPAVQWALAVSGLAHLAGGLLPGDPIFYETWLVPGVAKYDQVVHLAVSAVLTFAAWQLVGRWVDEQRCSAAARALLAAGLASGFGAVNEVFEFLSALRFDDAYIGGLENTGWDLVFNTFGVAAAAVWLANVAGARAVSGRPLPSPPAPSTGA